MTGPLDRPLVLQAPCSVYFSSQPRQDLFCLKIFYYMLPRPAYPISCSVFFIHAIVMTTINLAVLVSFVTCTILLGGIFARKPCSSRLRVALWYTVRIPGFVISIMAVFWAVRDSVEGPSFSFASASVAVAVSVFALSLVEPLKERLETLAGLARKRIKIEEC